MGTYLADVDGDGVGLRAASRPFTRFGAAMLDGGAARGDEHGRDAIGAELTMRVGDKTIHRDVRAAFSYWRATIRACTSG
jgi:hypothetical protein